MDGGVGLSYGDKPSRKPRDKTRYVLETLEESGWTPLTLTDPAADIPEFADAAEAAKWRDGNVIPPARVRCVVVKWDVELKEETVKTTKVVPVS